MYYEKFVDDRELRFISILLDTDIIPKTVICERQIITAPRSRVEETRIVMEKYPMTIGALDSIPDDAEEKIQRLFVDLHKRGILHGDAHPHNMVYNPTTGDVRLIDFGDSYLMSEVEDNLGEIAEFWDAHITSLDQAIEYEKTMYLRF